MNQTLRDGFAYTFFEDSGHGWLRVQKSELRTLELTRMISNYSYESKNLAYLEEDCDAPLFVKAWEAYHGKHWDWKTNSVTVHHHGQSGIRKMRPYRS